MTEQISQRELRHDSGRIMRGLGAGYSYIVTRRHEPAGELRRRRLVDAVAVTEMFCAAPPIDRDRLAEDVDAVIDQGVDPCA